MNIRPKWAVWKSLVSPLFFLQPSSGGTRDPVAHVLELKLKALILDTIHSIDVVQILVQNGVKTTAHWLWQKQLRFYLKKGIRTRV